MEVQQLVGYVAASLTTGSFIPQVFKIWKAKRADDISLNMYIIYVFGIIMWLTYGLLIKQYPIIIANTLTLLFSSAVLIMKLKFK